MLYAIPPPAGTSSRHGDSSIHFFLNHPVY